MKSDLDTELTPLLPKVIDTGIFLLRVLLAKWPDICAPIFLMPYLFGCIIKSTPLGGVTKAKSWDLGAYTVPWGAI